MNTSPIRITGLASGFDTDQMVKDLMRIEQLKVDKIKKQKTYAEWTQVAYREQSNTLKDFQNTFFDVLNKEDNMITPTGFNKFKVKTLSAGNETSAVEITGNHKMVDGKHVINSIDQLATADTWKASQGVHSVIKSSGLSDVDTINAAVDAGNNSFKVSVNGNYKTITLDKIIDLNADGNIDKQDLAEQLNNKMEEAFGVEYNDVVSIDNGELAFSKEGSKLKISALDNEALNVLGIEDGSVTGIDSKKSLKDIFGTIGEDLSKFEINGVKINGLTEDTTLDQFLTKVNNSAANVQIKYDTLKQEFSMKSKEQGAVNNIELNQADTVNFLANHLKIEDGANRTKGVNARATIDGVAITRSSNNFEIDGINYKLKSLHNSGDPIEIDVKPDSDAIYGKIKKFVDEYNKMTKSIQDKIRERKNADFKPLSDDEKKAMSEDEVKKWEEKARAGILYNDRDLSKILDDMRKALYNKVDGVDVTLSDIGIETSKNWKEGNKLIINESKLKKSIENKYDDVVALFTTESDKEYFEEDSKAERYSESGLSVRLKDIIKDNIRVSTNNAGQKGVLVEKAGLDGLVDTSSDMYERVKDFSDRIDEEMRRFYDKQESYYKQFSAMEAALAKMQSQSDWIAQQLGSL